MEFPTIDQLAKEVAEKALDGFTYEGKTLREWVEILAKLQPSEDCISRQAVLDNAYAYDNGLGAEGYCVNVEDIQELPSVTPQPKMGKWNYVTHYARRYRVCSECNAEKEDDRATGWNFCPHCGADMIGGDTDETN